MLFPILTVKKLLKCFVKKRTISNLPLALIIQNAGD